MEVFIVLRMRSSLARGDPPGSRAAALHSFPHVVTVTCHSSWRMDGVGIASRSTPEMFARTGADRCDGPDKWEPKSHIHITEDVRHQVKGLKSIASTKRESP